MGLRGIDLSLVFKLRAFSLAIVFKAGSLNLAAGILGDIITANLCLLFQRFDVLRCDYVTFGHNNLTCWFKNDILFDGLTHCRAQLCQGIAFGLSGRFQLLFAAGLGLYAVFFDAISGFEDIAISFVFQLIDQLYNLIVKVLFQLEKFLVQAHQFTLASILIDISDDVEREVENSLQIARREIKQETDTAGSSFEVPDMAHR